MDTDSLYEICYFARPNSLSFRAQKDHSQSEWSYGVESLPLSAVEGNLLLACASTNPHSPRNPSPGGAADNSPEPALSEAEGT
jgi:hypothetical protein